jgi:hypothetical protein
MTIKTDGCEAYRKLVSDKCQAYKIFEKHGLCVHGNKPKTCFQCAEDQREELRWACGILGLNSSSVGLDESQAYQPSPDEHSVECFECFDEFGSYGCLRPAHSAWKSKRTPATLQEPSKRSEQSQPPSEERSPVSGLPDARTGHSGERREGK